MLMAARGLPGASATLQPEALFGLQWITKLWNPVRKVLYAQVGSGNGNAGNTIQGDYNFWFLPQQEDRMNVSHRGNPGPTAYFVKYRPVFEAAPPGQPVSPDLAGRFAADFALGAQLSAGADPAQAGYLLALARGVYAMAKTTNVGQLVTAFPHDYYPGTEWKSDMAWGAAEIALADEATGAPAAQLRADLAGSLTGTGDIQLGATTDGPSDPANFAGLGAGSFTPFNTRTAAYEDNVVSWPSVEPADDYAADSLLAFALGTGAGAGLG